MGLKIKIIIIVIILIIGFIGGLYYAGVFDEGGIAKLIIGGDDVSTNFLSEEEKKVAEECTDPACLFENFNDECEVSYGFIPVEEQEMLLYMEIAGKKEEKCVMNIRLEDANGPAAFAKGLDATCLIAPEDVNGIEENFDMDAMNCEGPLYEAAKLAQ